MIGSSSEYTAAIGMIYEGQTETGLTCIKNIRDRYDGLKRSPFDEGRWKSLKIAESPWEEAELLYCCTAGNAIELRCPMNGHVGPDAAFISNHVHRRLPLNHSPFQMKDICLHAC